MSGEQVLPSSTKVDVSGKQRLLEAVARLFLEEGISGHSLRQIAAKTGTSHRMLRYHFGDLRSLISSAMGEVRRIEITSFSEALNQKEPKDIRAALEFFWQHNTSPEIKNYFRLLFEYWGAALHDRRRYEELLQGIVSGWVDLLVPVFERTYGDNASVASRLAVGALRGLILDLLTTEDREEVSSAYRLLIDQLARE